MQVPEREDVDKLVGDPFNPKPRSSIAAGGRGTTLGPPDWDTHDDRPERQPRGGVQGKGTSCSDPKELV